VVGEKNNGGGGTVLEYCAHPDCNTSGELGSFVVARELDQDSERFR